MADIVLINPRFEPSYWGLDHAMPILGKRANLPVACLPLLAALTPPEHTVSLIDENVEAIDFDRCVRADLVGVTGMIVQRARTREILSELKARGVFTVVGGPWVSVEEDYFLPVRFEVAHCGKGPRFPGLRAPRLSEAYRDKRKRRTHWRCRESSANPSLLRFPVKQGKYREFSRIWPISPSLRRNQRCISTR